MSRDCQGMCAELDIRRGYVRLTMGKPVGHVEVSLKHWDEWISDIRAGNYQP